jgi:cytoskeletal protein RodZ
MADFGSSFKNARESSGLTLEQIASETRISTRFLQAIESEDFGILPGGIFSRGFIRSYAERLGMDPEKALADFERLSNYREPVLMEGLRVSTPPPDKTNRRLYSVAVLGLVVLVVVVYIVTRPSAPLAVVEPQVATQTAQADPPTPAPTPTTEPAPPPAPPPQQQPAPEPPEEPRAMQALALVLEVREETWIKVTADDSVLASEILQPGTTRRFTAQTSIGLVIGNAGGLDIKINDREVRPLGKSGQVRTLTITPENLKDFIGE